MKESASKTDHKSSLDDPVKPRQRNALKKRDRILSAALDVFSVYGLHGASMDQIAAVADVSKANLFYYSKSKEHLYLSVLESLLDDWLEPLTLFSIEQEPAQALRHYVRTKLEIARDHPAESRLFCMEIVQGAPLLNKTLSTSLRNLVKDKSTVIQHWIDSGKIRSVSPVHLIFSIWATTQHYSDFSAQVEAVTGKTLADKEFFNTTLANLELLLVDSILTN